mmetsp:Transcript_82473/g.163734  ORF Transcript_82473/g.163734 Transcript_82473/m.163734 type:complete len:585 (+) Transcript_82473:50-1804(+)|eukprot:CAMPEP_0172672142 /NCGR_PEP_ID=MMETSP1074-20121228/11368_1 /TAXON_ID=2916 /ORGANISM="Ceratium fusus, Strain PA161109" /LENGTH=584 /DNA_ID=CAMNT_0013489297 /DNA_START=49 /DNA_END=1803 /DNA_ORIENTATION=+
MTGNRILKLKAEKEDEFGRPHDRFMLGQRLAHCGMGEVRMCTRLANNENFAVKIISRRALRSSPRQEVLLRREIRTLRELHHPNVVRLHDAFWEEEGSCYIVMDLARDGDLREKILRHKGLGSCASTSEAASKYVGRQLIAGITYMHNRRVIHRDLKAENILVSKTQPAPGGLNYSLYDVKISDFGLATWLDIVGELLTPCGTPNYLAPEIMQDNYDERIDFWSFGVVLYMMLCGDFPFEMYQDPSDVERILQQSVKESAAWQSVSSNAKDFVCGLLVFDPELRLCHGNCLRHVWMSGESGDEAFVNAAPMTHVITPTGSTVANSEDSGPTHAGAVEKVTGWVGTAVDSIQLRWRDGSSHPHGGLGGFEKLVYNLSPGEIIIGVGQETRDVYPENLGNSIVLYTSFCQVLAFQGSDAWQRSRFVAPVGSQIIGLQFVGSSLCGIHLESVSGKRGAVACISGHVGYGVDQIFLDLRNGSARKYGCEGEGGLEQGPWSLAEDEIITIVEQAYRDEFLGNSIAFYTSAGNIHKLSGMASSSARRVSAPSGSQICSLEFDGSNLMCVQICPEHVCSPEPGQLELRSLT